MMARLLMVVFGSYLPSPHIKTTKQNKTKQNVVKVGPPLTKLSGSAHGELNEKLRTQAVFMRTAKTMIRMDCCMIRVYSRDKWTHCWFSHFTAENCGHFDF